MVLPITLPADGWTVFSSVSLLVAADDRLTGPTVSDGNRCMVPTLIRPQEKMLKGMDDIDLTLAEAQLIRDFEVGHRQRQPWLFVIKH